MIKISLTNFFTVKGETEQESKRMYSNMLKIAVPSCIEGALMSVISAVDTMMVGALGAASLAGVGLTAQPRLTLLVFVQALCVGTTAVIARRKGADDPLGARRCLNQSMAIITVLGLIISVLGHVFAKEIVVFSGANPETLPFAKSYFAIIALGILPNCWQLCICAAFRAIGKTTITLTTNLIANLLNVCFNYVLINGKLGFPRLGVVGAAIASVIGTVVASLMSFYFVMRGNSYFVYNPFKRVRFDKATIASLTKIGSATALEALFLRGGFMLVQIVVAGLGTIAFASYQIVSQVTGLSFTVGDGLATAAVSMVGQSLGAKNKEKAKQYVAISRKMGIVVSLSLMLIIILMKDIFPRFFTSEASVIENSALSFLVIAFSMYPQNVRVIYSGSLRGAGDAKYVAVCSFVGVTIFRPLSTFLLCYKFHFLIPALKLDVIGPWVSYFFDALIRTYLLQLRIKSGKWTEIVVK